MGAKKVHGKPYVQSNNQWALSNWKDVSSQVLQRSVQCLVLAIVFVNKLDDVYLFNVQTIPRWKGSAPWRTELIFKPILTNCKNALS